jgi:CheY-like chemotaxis protein
MVYSIVKAHGGKIDIQSEVRKGTCVTVVFPACAPESPTCESPSEDGGGNTAGGLLVLVIDDDDLIQISMGMMLEALGFRTLTALCGEDGLAKVEAGERPDVVILDMNMPGLGGLGTLPRLRALLPTLPVLLATGRVDQTALDLVTSDPNTVLLSKPFALSEVKAKMKAILKQA